MAANFTSIEFDPNAPEGYRVYGMVGISHNTTGGRFTVRKAFASEAALDALTVGQLKAQILAQLDQDFPSVNT